MQTSVWDFESWCAACMQTGGQEKKLREILYLSRTSARVEYILSDNTVWATLMANLQIIVESRP